MNTTDCSPEFVTELIALDRKVTELTELLKLGKEKLVQAAIVQHTKDLGHASILGCAYSFVSTTGESASVSFPKDKLISAFVLEGDIAVQLRGKEPRVERVVLGDFKKWAGEEFKNLFAKVYKPAKAFRELAPRLLTPGAASRIIHACEEPSAARVSFKTKDPL